MDISIEEIQEKFDGLPEDIKWLIMQADMDGKITEIGQRLKLTVPQMAQLSLETNMMMMGFTHPNKFESSLIASMGLPEEKVKEIVNEVNEKILKGIREKLMTLYTKEGSGEAVSRMPLDTGEELESREEILKTIENENPSNKIDYIGTSSVPNMPPTQNTTPPLTQNPPRKTEEEMRSILNEKLSGNFQMPKTTTIHSLNNLTKNSAVETTTSSSKKDPYRESVDN